MNHSFDTDIAKKYGVNNAIFLHNIAFWTHYNQANKKHIHDGRCWTYNTHDAFCELFPYWSIQNIRTIINNCIKLGLLVSGNYNQTKYDRTCWYALTDEGISLFSMLKTQAQLDLLVLTNETGLDMLELTNGNVGTNRPIPDNKQDKLDTIIDTISDPIKTLKKYEIKTPQKLTSVQKNYLKKAIDLLSEEKLTLEDYLKYLTNRCSRSLLPYSINGKERQNGFGNLLRPSFINDVLSGKWED